LTLLTFHTHYYFSCH